MTKFYYNNGISDGTSRTDRYGYTSDPTFLNGYGYGYGCGDGYGDGSGDG